jgi:hypothetical protein
LVRHLQADIDFMANKDVLILQHTLQDLTGPMAFLQTMEAE